MLNKIINLFKSEKVNIDLTDNKTLYIKGNINGDLLSMGEMIAIQKADKVIVCDENGNTRVLKNRYGKID